MERSPKRARYYLDGLFVVEHRPEGTTARPTGVLILPPLGYEDTCAYRPLRVLADALARDGSVVLRLDWPSLGDSALDAEAPDIVERCVAGVEAAARSLRERGLERVAAVGVRAGALFGLASQGLDELALWAPPPSGKRYLREERAFHKMAARAFGERPPPPPQGAVEAGGFLYGAATVRALEELDAASLAAASGCARALVIGRDGSAPPAPVVAALQAGGAEVRAERVDGLGDLLENPYHAALSPGVLEAVRAFFDDPARAPVGPAAGAATLGLPGGVQERPLLLPGEAGELSGIVCAPAGPLPRGLPWTLFFNAGGIRRCGPNRLWTRAARRLARAGRPSLRIDVRDVGDSDGATTPHEDLEAMYSEASIADAVLAHDAVVELGASEVEVVGLCSGSFLGAQVAARRPTRRALLFNCLAFVWDDDARASSMTDHIASSLLDRRRWVRLLTGRIDALALARAIVDKGRMKAEGLVMGLRGEGAPDPVDVLLRSIVRRGTELHLVSSADDPSIAYLERHVPAGRRPRLTVLPGVDHTIRPVWAHDRVLELIRRGL